MTRALLLVALGCLAGCAMAKPVAPLQVSRVVAVFPPNNMTGDPLVIAGTGPIERYVLRAERATVPDVLLSEARFQLQTKGFDVVDRLAVDTGLGGHVPKSPADAAALAARGGIRSLVLYLELRRWEPDAPMHTAFVIVGLSATLMDPSTGRVLWHEERRAAPVPTPGEIRLQAAYVTAARKVIEEMLKPLRPEPPATSRP